MTVADRIAALRSEGEAAVSSATGTAELEEVRVRFLGRKAELPLEQRLARDVVDVTLPGTPITPAGHHHVITAVRREIEDVFLGLGFRVAEGPEADLVYYNFDALNFTENHPTRLEADTFYLADDIVLRTHTSPMQIRAMELQPPPIYIVVPGRTY